MWQLSKLLTMSSVAADCEIPVGGPMAPDSIHPRYKCAGPFRYRRVVPLFAVALLASLSSIWLLRGDLGHHFLGHGIAEASSQDEADFTDPQSWIGRSFPMLDGTPDVFPLARGRWLVLLADGNCSSCDLLVEQFLEIAGEIAAGHSTKPTAGEIQFCVLAYGAEQAVREPKSNADRRRNTEVLRVQSSSQIVPGSRCVVHLDNAEVGQVFAPAELGLVLRVFGS